jgi:serine protease Do
MKSLIASLLLFLTLTSWAQPLPKLFKKLSKSVVFIDVVSYDYSNLIYNQTVGEEESLGSGVLISENGMIWTASHVIQHAEKIKVEFLDGDNYEAEVIASDPNADVALLKISPGFELKNKTVAVIGDSDKTEVGEDIFVIGAPHGFKQSLSKGIISGRYSPESLSNDFDTVEFLQTDAAINPGNSGGPMFNMKGEVVGIASRIYTLSGGFDGIGFAVTSNVAKAILEDSNSPWTGMESIVLSEDMASILNVPQKSGLLILKLSSKGSVAKLGLRGGFIPSTIAGKDILLGGDIVLEFAGIEIQNQSSIHAIKEKLKVLNKGEKVSFSVLRNGAIGNGEFEKQ